MGRLLSVIITTVVAVVAAGALFVLANQVVSLARRSWPLFTGIVGAISGAIGFGLFRGNRVVRSIIASPDPKVYGGGSGLLGNLEWSIVGAIGIGGAAWVIGSSKNRAVRLATGAAVGLALGVLVGAKMLVWERPGYSIGALLLWTVIGAAIGAAVTFRGGHYVQGAMFGAAAGFIVGAWLTPAELGSGSMVQTSLAVGVPLALGLMGFGWPDPPDATGKAGVEERSRAVVFLAPAVTFLICALIVPALITINISFRNDKQRNPPLDNSEQFVGFRNYKNVLTNPDTLELANWRHIFTSQLFWAGAVLILAGVAIAYSVNYARNRTVGIQRTGGSTLAMSAGVFLFAFAVFSVLRGTLMNNFWWVFTVASVSTVMGLAIAVLSERAGRLESFSKAFIFMPMAVSMVGASIVWRLQYQARDVNKNQTGVLNAVWVWLGRLSNSGWPRIFWLIVLAAAMALLARSAYRSYQRGGGFAMQVGAILCIAYPFIKLAMRNLGGFTITSSGEVVPQTVFFVQNAPFNNVFLMIVLIWIQTGFAMVILSAAIKAVPSELLEASELDGAGPGQQFFQVVLPQIFPTVGVVVTTLIVTVTKVFDIVKVTTNGQFGTQVLANAMFEQSFQFFNQGTGAALATLILVVILPVLVFNVYQLTKEEV